MNDCLHSTRDSAYCQHTGYYLVPQLELEKNSVIQLTRLPCEPAGRSVEDTTLVWRGFPETHVVYSLERHSTGLLRIRNMPECKTTFCSAV